MAAPLAQSSAIRTHSILAIVRQHTVTAIAVLFLLLVLFSAYLGWSATHTVDAIYQSASVYLKAHGQPVPPNPVLQTSPLGLLRNMATYVSLMGALAALVVGHQLIAADRKAGVLQLLGTRPLDHTNYAMGKLGALLLVLLGLIGFGALVSAGTFAILPAFHLTMNDWLHLIGFYAISYLYMSAFGLLALAFAARARTETVGLLIPLVAWLSFTFILPQITSNTDPVAALNPVSALANPPQSLFFNVAGALLEPFSLAETYRIASAQLLHFLPPDFHSRAVVPPIASLIAANLLAGWYAWRTLGQLDFAKGDYHD